MTLLRRATAILSVVVFGSVAFASSVKAPESKPFQPAAWNASVRENGNGTSTGQFHSKWINFNDGQKWNKIDLSLHVTTTGATLFKAPYALNLPLYADGPIRFTATNKFDLAAKTVRTEPSISKTKRWVGALHVKGHVESGSMVYTNALPIGDIVLQPHEQEFRSIVRINAPPTGTGDISVPFTESYSDSLVPRHQGQPIGTTEENVADGFGASLDSFRGITTLPAKVWDSDIHSQDIKVLCKQVGTLLSCRKIIPRTFLNDPKTVYPVFSDTTSTFFPNPSAETTSTDGYVARNAGDALWATCHDTATGQAADHTGTLARASADDGGGGVNFTIFRSFILFDTSSIGATNSVSAANVQIWITTVTDTLNDGHDYINVMGNATPASNTTLGTADYNKEGTTKMSSDKDYTGLATGAYTTFTMNATGLANISLTSITKWGVQEGHDIDNSSPGASGGNNQVNFNTADQTGTSNDPVLTATYAAAGATTTNHSKVIMIMFIPAAFRDSESLLA